MAAEQISVLSEITHLLLGAVSGGVGLWLGRYLTKRKEEVNTAFDMHKELNSADMSKHRHSADLFVKEHPTLSIQELENLDSEKALSIYLIMRFYQRLWMAIKYRRIDRKIAMDLFADNFYYWYYIFFEKSAIPQGWWSTEQIRELANYYEHNFSRHAEVRENYLVRRKDMLKCKE